jgi:hypothetical protein
MSVASTDLVIYGAGTPPDSDSGTMGGAIATTIRYIFDSSSLANSLADTLEVLSSSAGDTTQTVTVYGRNSTGSIVNEVFTLAGTTVQNGATTFTTILKIVVSASHAGTITVRKATGDTTVAAIETGVLQIRRPFYNVSSDATGGSTRNFYEKVFIKNTHATLSLLSAVISENADPAGLITFDLEDAVNDNNSVASRLDTAPSGMLGSFDSSSKNCPGTDLAAGSAIGVWLKLTLTAGASAALSTYTLRIAGSST